MIKITVCNEDDKSSDILAFNPFDQAGDTGLIRQKEQIQTNRFFEDKRKELTTTNPPSSKKPMTMKDLLEFDRWNC